jgi:hypothetical protein
MNENLKFLCSYHFPQGHTGGDVLDASHISGRGSAVCGGTGLWSFSASDAVAQQIPDDQVQIVVALGTGTNIAKGISWGIFANSPGNYGVQLYRNDTGAAVDLSCSVTVYQRFGGAISNP